MIMIFRRERLLRWRDKGCGAEDGKQRSEDVGGGGGRSMGVINTTSTPSSHGSGTRMGKARTRGGQDFSGRIAPTISNSIPSGMMSFRSKRLQLSTVHVYLFKER